MEKPVISLKNVVKSYGDFTLGPVDLEIEPGYVVAVVGPNGSGKSTLFRMLMNLARQDEGEVRVFGGATRRTRSELSRRSATCRRGPSATTR